MFSQKNTNVEDWNGWLVAGMVNSQLVVLVLTVCEVSQTIIDSLQVESSLSSVVKGKYLEKPTSFIYYHENTLIPLFVLLSGFSFTLVIFFPLPILFPWSPIACLF